MKQRNRPVRVRYVDVQIISLPSRVVSPSSSSMHALSARVIARPADTKVVAATAVQLVIRIASAAQILSSSKVDTVIGPIGYRLARRIVPVPRRLGQRRV